MIMPEQDIVKRLMDLHTKKLKANGSVDPLLRKAAEEITALREDRDRLNWLADQRKDIPITGVDQTLMEVQQDVFAENQVMPSESWRMAIRRFLDMARKPKKAPRKAASGR